MRHRRDIGRIRSGEPGVNVEQDHLKQDHRYGPSLETGHHASAINELLAGAVKARRPRGTRGRSEAQRLDSAENSSKLERVMTGGVIRALCPQKSRAGTGPGPVLMLIAYARNLLARSALESEPAGGEYLRQSHRTFISTIDTDIRGVSDHRWPRA
jgi:hypothetical protein